MIPWIPYTFVRTVIFFIGGIVLAFYAPGLISEFFSVALAVCFAAAYVVIVLFRRLGRRWINPGWIALPLVFLLGYAHLLLQTESRREDHLLHEKENIVCYRAIVTRFAEEKARSWKIEARVDGVRASQWERREGRIVLYFPKSDFPEPFEYGDVLLIKGQPQRPPPAMNPGEFDYGKYLALRSIYHQHFVPVGNVVRIGHEPDNIFRDLAYRGRRWAEETLSRFVEGDREQAIASALVLGITDGLDNELLDAYSATGTMHILAVSGLHISLIYFILLRMFSPLNRFRGGRWGIAFISLALLWLYAIVTGLSPSVLRAVMMFSFLAVARPWARSTNIYNTLAVSAFCLLFYDPFLIFSVGFQLSYLAVLGIVYIYPRILQLWEPRTTVTIELWKLCAVSIAAQLVTFPLGLLYFHQFPNYFLLSNLLVVPLSFVVLILGLVVLSVALIPAVAGVLGFCLEWVIRFLNGIVFMMDDFPFSVTEGIYISAWQAMLLLLLTALTLGLFEVKKFRYVVYCFATVCVFAGFQWWHFHRDVNIRKLTVYSISGHSAMDLIDRGQVLFVADTALKVDNRKIRYHIYPNRVIAGVMGSHEDVRMMEFPGGRLIAWNGTTILQLTGSGFQVPPGLRVDWLVVGNNAVRVPGVLANRIHCRKVILDGSNSFFFASRFLEAAKLHKLEVHSVLHQGAFDIKIENQDS